MIPSNKNTLLYEAFLQKIGSSYPECVSVCAYFKISGHFAVIGLGTILNVLDTFSGLDVQQMEIMSSWISIADVFAGLWTNFHLLNAKARRYSL